MYALLLCVMITHTSEAQQPIPTCRDYSGTTITDLGWPLQDSSRLQQLKEIHPQEYELVVNILKWLVALPQPDVDLASLGARDLCSLTKHTTMPASTAYLLKLGEKRYQVHLLRVPPSNN